jgi:hypothetical protein
MLYNHIENLQAYVKRENVGYKRMFKKTTNEKRLFIKGSIRIKKGK